jgi:hypothetical protein
MARDIDLSKPLSKEDIAYLKARHSLPYVERLVELAGTASSEPENGPQSGSDTDPAPSAPGSESGTENGGEDVDEDLIGSTTDFDPGQHTADEVLKHLKDASDEEKSRVLALEKDGKGRSTILNA